jgi:hypothetical protein
MISVRPQNLLFMAVLGVEGLAALLREWRTHADPRRLLRAVLPYALPALIVAAIALYLLAPSDGGGTPYVLRMGLLGEVRVIEQLFSPHHGLVSSSPVLAVALVGLPFLLRKDRVLAAGLMLAIGAQILVNGTSTNWNAGASFGARRFVECALPFAFGLAAAVEFARRRPLVPIGIGLGALAAMNLALVEDYRRGRITLSEAVPFERMVEAVTSRVGNPFAAPGAILWGWLHDLPAAQLDRMTLVVNTLRIDTGNPDHEPYLVSGWSNAERDSRHAFRWATGPEAIVAARLRYSRYTLRFHAEPFVWREAPRQVVEVRVQGRRIATLELTRGYRQYEVVVPEELISDVAVVRVSFRFSYARSPREIGMSDDPRRLAARFTLIEMVRREGE